MKHLRLLKRQAAHEGGRAVPVRCSAENLDTEQHTAYATRIGQPYSQHARLQQTDIVQVTPFGQSSATP